MSRSFIGEDLRLNISRELNEITVLISSGLASGDGIILRLDSVLEAIRSVSELTFVTWAAQVEHTLEQAIYELQQWGEVISEPRSVGRPRISVPTESIENLLAMNFSVPSIARMLHVSTDTIFRRMRDQGLSVR